MNTPLVDLTDDETPISLSTQLRDLADRIDETSKAQSVVCVIGCHPRATAYVFGTSVPRAMTNAKNFIDGVIESLPMTGQGKH